MKNPSPTVRTRSAWVDVAILLPVAVMFWYSAAHLQAVADQLVYFHTCVAAFGGHPHSASCLTVLTQGTGPDF